MFQFQIKYFILTIVLFVVELLIALFVHDAIIRPYVGDLLVVVLIYCFLKSFLNIKVVPMAIGVLLFSYMVEFLQYLNVVELLGLQGNRLARIIIGTTFSWHDLLAYTLGVMLVVGVEKLFETKVKPK